MKNQSLLIARTIHQQLMEGGKLKVWSWGANSWAAIENGLTFKVQGFKFTGRVNIILKPDDTYTIQFTKQNRVEMEYSDIYFDEQIDLIDGYVEYTGAKYAEDVKNAVYVL